MQTGLACNRSGVMRLVNPRTPHNVDWEEVDPPDPIQCWRHAEASDASEPPAKIGFFAFNIVWGPGAHGWNTLEWLARN